MKHNWQKAPSWANYAATCVFSGNREWFRSEPRSPGWVEVEARAYSGASTDHAEELAEALEEALIYTDGVTCEQHEEWKGVLRRYKQSRGE